MGPNVSNVPDTNSSQKAEIFVVDNDEFIKELLENFLEGLDCSVHSFTDGYHALDAARARKPVLIICEVMVLNLDGLSLCRLIKKDSDLGSVKVIVMSALSAAKSL